MSRARDLADGTFSGAFSADSPTLVVDDTNNRVGVGTATPSRNLQIGDNTDSAAIISLQTTTSGKGSIYFGDNTATSAEYSGVVRYDHADNSMQFWTSSTEAARIISNGTTLIGTTSEYASNNTMQVSCDAITSNGSAILTRCAATSVVYHINFRNGNGGVGGIYTTGTSTGYSTSSDYRLKENIVDLDGAIDRVKQLPARRFNFIADPDTTVDGFVAHEVADVVPEAITGTKDEVDEEGNPVYQGIDQSKLVPLLTAAIKEQQALIEDLQTRLAALEAV